MRKLWRRLLWRLMEKERDAELRLRLSAVEERNYDLAGVPRNRMDRELEEIQHQKEIE